MSIRTRPPLSKVPCVLSPLTPYRVAQRGMSHTLLNSNAPEAKFILVLEPRLGKRERQHLMHSWIRDRGPLRAAIAYVTATKASSGNRIYCGGRRWTGCNSLHPCLSMDHTPGMMLPRPGVMLRDDYTSVHRITNAKITAASCSGLKCIASPSEFSLPVAVTPQLDLAVIPRSLTGLNLTLFF